MKKLLKIALFAALFLFLLGFSNRSDFIAHYAGTQAALAGDTVYSPQMNQATQVAYYGRLARADEDQQNFAYPAYAILVFTPFTVVPYPLASLLWTALSLGLVLVMLRAYGRSWLEGLLLLVVLHQPLVALLLGQTVLWSAAWLGFGLLALKQKRNGLSALAFVLASLQPTIVIPLVLVILLRERRALLYYLSLMAAWLGVSLVAFGFWLPAWIASLSAYAGYTNYLVWIARSTPLLIAPALALLAASMLQQDVMKRGALALAALWILLPLTGLYHLALMLPFVVGYNRLRLVLLAAALWLLSPFSFEVRALEALLASVMVAGLVVYDGLSALELNWNFEQFSLHFEPIKAKNGGI